MATDNFNSGTPGNSLPTYSANWGTAVGGNSLAIVASDSGSNGAGGSVGGSWNFNYRNATFADAHYAKARVWSNAGAYIGVAIRVQTAAMSGYYCIAEPAAVFCGQLVDGSAYVDWDAGQAAVTDGDTIELAVDAVTSTTIHYKVNGSIVATYTGKSALSGGKPGVSGFGIGTAAISIDDWEGGDVVVTPLLRLPARLYNAVQNQ